MMYLQNKLLSSIMWLFSYLILFIFSGAVYAKIYSYHKCMKLEGAFEMYDTFSAPGFGGYDAVCKNYLPVVNCKEKVLFELTGLPPVEVAEYTQDVELRKEANELVHMKRLFEDMCSENTDLGKEFRRHTRCYESIPAKVQWHCYNKVLSTFEAFKYQRAKYLKQKLEEESKENEESAEEEEGEGTEGTEKGLELLGLEDEEEIDAMEEVEENPIDDEDYKKNQTKDEISEEKENENTEVFEEKEKEGDEGSGLDEEDEESNQLEEKEKEERKKERKRQKARRELSKLMVCLSEGFVSGCVAAAIHEKCGKDAYNTQLELMKRSSAFRSWVCDREKVTIATRLRNS